MGDQRSHNITEIEGLLGVRQQITGWLDRLDAAGSRAPESVRTKVRADYRARLAQVVAQLGTHADLIASTLEGLRAQAKQYLQSRSEEYEIRSEAELRHTVGEYTDDEWQLVELESSGKIEGFDQELGRLAGEISRLEEVQGLIMPAPARNVGPSAQATPEPEDIQVTHGLDMELPPMLDPEPLSADQPALTLVRDQPPPAPPRPEAPRFVPKPGSPKPRESAPARAIPFPSAPQQATQATQTTQTTQSGVPTDELAFLRSVTLDSAPASARPASHPATPAPSPMEREDRASQTVARTLKCGECGSLNRPTEWYCERCGAELAAL
jgi:hypothetical protein